MHTIIQWALMGGYAAYVWSAYGLVMAVLIFQWILIKRRGSHHLKRIIKWLNYNNESL